MSGVLSFFGLSAGNGHDPIHNFWYGDPGRGTVAGVNVSAEKAMTYSGCHAASMLLCTSGGMIPLKLFDTLATGGSMAAKDDPRYGMVHDSPNDDMTSMMYRCWGINQQVNRGNCYSEIERNGAGVGIRLWPIHQSRIPRQNILRDASGRIFYRVRNNNGSTTDIKSADMLHVPSPITDDGIVGIGVIERAMLTIGLGIAAETQGAAFFGNSARPTLVIEGGKFRDKEDREDYRRTWIEVHGGPQNNGRPALMPEGAKLTALTWNAQESQFLETRQFNIEEISRWYGVPPHMIQHLLRSTNNNIVQQALEFVKYSMMRWIVPWEQELNRKLLSAEERKTKFFKFVVEGLERADITTRTAALKDQFFNGELTLNEWRALEDRNPIGPLGDLHFVQSAMVPLEVAANGPVQPESAPPEGQPADDEPAVEHEEPELFATPADIESLRSELASTIDTLMAALQAKDAALEASRAVQSKLAATMLRDVMSRMVSLEVNAVKRVAEKPTRMFERLEEFYVKHALTMERSLTEPVAACLAIAGDARDPAALVKELSARHVAESQRQFIALCDGPPDEMPNRLDACVSKWHEERVVVL